MKIKNDNVIFDVSDVVTVLHCLEMLLILYMFKKILFAFMLLVLLWLD